MRRYVKNNLPCLSDKSETETRVLGWEPQAELAAAKLALGRSL
jgi:hypothetical protein